MTAWITKYALTMGIFPIEYQVCISDNEMIIDIRPNAGGSYYHKNEWHSSKEEAIKYAKAMKIKKIQSLDKKIKKLEALDFNNQEITCQ